MLEGGKNVLQRWEKVFQRFEGFVLSSFREELQLTLNTKDLLYFNTHNMCGCCHV